MHLHSYNQFGEVCFQKAQDIKRESDSNGFVRCILSRMCVQHSGHWHRLQLVKWVQILADAVMLIITQILLGKVGIFLPSQRLNNKVNWAFCPWVETRREEKENSKSKTVEKATENQLSFPKSHCNSQFIKKKKNRTCGEP